MCRNDYRNEVVSLLANYDNHSDISSCKTNDNLEISSAYILFCSYLVCKNVSIETLGYKDDGFNGVSKGLIGRPQF